MKSKVALIFTSLLLASPLAFAADDTAQLKQQVAALQAQVNQLQGQLNQRNGQATTQLQQPGAQSSTYAYDDWDPFREMALMHRQMARFMQDNMANSPGMMFEAKSDIKQTDNAYIVTVDLPGMDKSNINVEVKDNTLMISGDRTNESKQDSSAQGNQYYRQERSFGHFMQAIPLPEDAKSDHIDAQYNNGVLNVTIPREKKADRKNGSQKIAVK